MNLRCALQHLQTEVGKVERTSSFIESEPWGYRSTNLYMNACCMLRTSLSPIDLLHATQEIERKMGRIHKTKNQNYQDRIIDIDILLYDELKLCTDELTIPHPLMAQRTFVMMPLSEIMDIDRL